MKSNCPITISKGESHLNALKHSGDAGAMTEFYREAGKSENTQQSYKNAVNHFRFTWGGQLPATTESVCNYLSTFAQEYKVSTLRQRLAALSKWHKSQGFPDPTGETPVKETMRGIAKLHQERQKQAYPLTFKHLVAICDALEAQKIDSIRTADRGEILRTHRDLALILVGFWQGFRSDELSRIVAENIVAHRDQGMTIFLPFSKTDKDARGKKYELPVLLAYCPTTAYLNWLQVANITSGPVFKAINRWGRLAKVGINKKSIEQILNRVSDGLFPGEPRFTTHSLRRGFADWAVNENWDANTLMQHVGWRSLESARKYMPVRKDFGALAMKPYGGALSNESDISTGGSTLLADFTKLTGPE
ncbi:tyrosine-type recombinase/integrase [Pseudomonas syringae]|nr:tyrosine-type recombinase/integrase [Pseudomonas syringae]